MATAEPIRGIPVYLPITEQEGWVLLTAFGIALASLLVWLVLQEAPERKKRGDNPALTALNTFSIVLAPVWLLLFSGVLYGFWRIFSTFGAAMAGDDLRWHVLAFVGLITALGALATAPLALIRVYTTERQTRVAEQGHMTDRISKAVEQLGAEKTVKRRVNDAEGKETTVEETVPNIEVRIGGIYALERIAQDSMATDKGRDHIRVMELLCAYVRENAPAGKARDHGFDQLMPLSVEATKEERAAHLAHLAQRQAQLGGRSRGRATREWAASLPGPRTDIKTALEVIGRRSIEQFALERLAPGLGEASGYRLDLRATCLQRADMTFLKFSHAVFVRARLEGAHFSGAQMEGAHLYGARMAGAVLRGAQMEGAILHLAQMEGADLWGANLKSADLTGWSGARASLRAADFTGASNMTQEAVNAAWGDCGTILPAGLLRPDHWDIETLENVWEADPKYQAWLDAGAPTGKPGLVCPDDP